MAQQTLFSMDSVETRMMACSSGVHHERLMGSTFCLALRPEMERFREEFEGGGVAAFTDDISLDLTGG